MSASLVPGIVIMSDVAPLGTESYWALSTSTHTTQPYTSPLFPETMNKICAPQALSIFSFWSLLMEASEEVL